MNYAILDIDNAGLAVVTARKAGRTWKVIDHLNGKSWVAKYATVLSSALCFQHSAPSTVASVARQKLRARVGEILTA